MTAVGRAPAARADLPSDAPLPSCLDQSIKDELGEQLRPRGVQEKTFLRQGRLELTARGGLFGGDLASSSWIAGGALAFWFTEDLALETSVEVTPVALDLDRPLAEFFGDDRFEPGTGYLGLANLVWAPIHAKMKVGGGIVHADLMLYAGAGRLFHDSVQGLSFDAGGALELLLSKYLTVRIDTRDVMAVQEAVAETRFTNNLVTTLGLSLWIPTPL
ncbi:MAG: outer membrane beta-barrel domain-containing protein [Kofleriaceae bacterium]